jgi:hypothetical protein
MITLEVKIGLSPAKAPSDEMEIISEKRRFARVKTSIPIYYRPISEAERERLRELIRLYPSSERARMGSHLVSIPLTSQPRELDAAILQVLGEINRKLDAIMEHLGIDIGLSGLFKRGTTIDLSGSGVRFSGKARAEKEDLFQITLEIPSSEAITAIAKVVLVKGGVPPSERIEIACDFTEINDKDREIIVEYCESLRQGKPSILPKTPLPRI